MKGRKTRGQNQRLMKKYVGRITSMKRMVIATATHAMSSQKWRHFSMIIGIKFLQRYKICK
jgi:hypothetical protein